MQIQKLGQIRIQQKLNDSFEEQEENKRPSLVKALKQRVNEQERELA